jgi:hypothetical protein
MSEKENEEALSVSPRETHDAATLPPPPSTAFDNPQLALFQTALCNNDEQRDRLSNLIDLWDSVPRYSVSRQQMTKIRVDGEFLREHRVTFQHRQRSYTCVIRPAMVKDLDGKQRDYYPSANEEIVEDALRKLAVERNAGYFDRPNYRSGVQFTLHELRKELEKRGHTRSYQEIVQSLDILSQSIVDILPEGGGEGKIRSACLPSLAAVSRKQLKDDPEAKWAVQFHPLVTGAIDQVTHRQYNYAAMMSHTTQLARWLHKQINLKYTFADLTNKFDMRYSTIKRDSGLLNNHKRERFAIDVLEEAFKSLVTVGVIRKFDRINETGPRKKLMDVVFRLYPHVDFMHDTKAANKRQRLADEKLGRRPVGIAGGSSIR